MVAWTIGKGEQVNLSEILVVGILMVNWVWSVGFTKIALSFHLWLKSGALYQDQKAGI